MKHAIRHQVLPTEWNARERLRGKGQFWTPPWVSRAMVGYVSQSSRSLLDPATGRGAFFEGALALGLRDLDYLGVDVDAEVLADPIYQHPSARVEHRDFLKNPPAGCFPAIVANPPYIRHHRLDKGTKEFLRELCFRITGFRIDGRAGYHVYFLLQALRLLEEGGRLAFIMPADTAEGKFSSALWQWITRHYRLEAVVAFEHAATPFPGVDTNPLIFLVRNAPPSPEIFWVKCRQAYNEDLYGFIASGFSDRAKPSLDIHVRALDEALETGLSRPPQDVTQHQYRLSDFARVMRGIATGGNEFFFLTRKQAKALGIGGEYLRLAVGRTRDAESDVLTARDMAQLDALDRPTQLLYLDAATALPAAVKKYLKQGEQAGLPVRALIQQRKPWYKMEKRDIPPILFAYLGRRNTRFIRNDAGALPLTGFLCIYPKQPGKNAAKKLWQALNDPATLANLKLVAKSYGAGAIKVEPRGLDRLPIPDAVVKKYGLL